MNPFTRMLIVWLLCLPGLNTFADNGDSASTINLSISATASVPTTELVKSRIDEISAATEINEKDKAALTELYRQTLSNLELNAAHRKKADSFKAIIEDGSNELTRLNTDLKIATDEAATPPGSIDNLPLFEIEQKLQRLKADQAIAETRLAELENEYKNEKDRPSQIRKRLAQVQSLLAKYASTPKTAPENTEFSDLNEARSWLDASHRVQLRSEALMLEQELSSHPTRQDLLEAKRDLAEINLKILKQQVDFVEDAANRIRLEEAGEAKAEALAAEQVASSKHPLLAELASRNTKLSEEIDRLANEIEGINEDEIEAADAAKQIELDFNTTQQKLEIAGLSQVLGQLLQQKKRALPDTGHFQKQRSIRETKIAETSLYEIQLIEERRALRDKSQYIDSLAGSLLAAERLEIAPELEKLISSRSALIEKAISVQRAYLQSLGELEISQLRLQDVVFRYDNFLDKRLLWIRSTEPVGLDTIMRIPGQAAELLAPTKWQALVKSLLNEVFVSPLFGLALILTIVWVVTRKKLDQLLIESGANVGNLLRDRLTDTLRAMLLIFLIVLPAPLLMLTVGWLLNTSLETTDFTKLIGRSFMMLSPLLFQLQALSLFLAPKSVARVHFGWRESGIERLHQDLGWFTPTIMIMAFVTIIALTDLELGSGSGLGRLLFLILMTVFGVFFYRLAKPKGGTLSILASEDPANVVFRLRHLWFFLLVGPPLGSALVSLAGYMFTAGTLIDRILQSTWFALLVIIVHQLILRWLTLNQRQFRLEAAKAKRRAEQEARQARKSQDDIEGLHTREIEEPEIDLKELDATSRKLLNNALLVIGLVGLWGIWRDVMPAFQILNDVTLWSYTRSEDNEIVPITLSSLALAIIVIIGTVIATRQLPAFIEMALLKHLDMSQGSRYTVTTLTRYTLVALGTAWVFGFLGGSWSEIQWIFAALGVGIGFGLQEIVANFISGLIILFERPIRVGDVVTVGDTDGVVTRIQIRATTIRNFDRKELLVPNKNFITQELLNWSLSDQTTRIMIKVGVAYGSDAERALLIMEEVAKEHPRVINDPAPFCVFEEFGDNALLLSLRCYIDDIDYRLRTITDINIAINQRMTDAGIEIAFPQRDIHLDTKHPLDIHLHHKNTEKD
jgi:potassium-dependent mechanosensitive channel